MIRRLLRLAGLACMLGVLASCSTARLAYNNAEAWVRFEADGYFDFDDAQALEFRERLARFHDWHREKELPVYAGLLELARKKAGTRVRQADVAWAIAALRERYHVAVAKAIEDAAPILVTLQDTQFKTLEKKLAEGNEKYEKEFLAGDERRQLRARTKRMWERFEDWIGGLSDAQEARIERFVREHSRYTVLRFEDRQQWQREAVSLMRRYRAPSELVPPLTAVFTHPETRRSAEYLREAARWEADLADLIADIDRSLSKEQRSHLTKRMGAYIEDCRVLAGESKLSSSSTGTLREAK